MQNNYSNQQTEYAGFWVRLAAYCIDSIIVWLALLLVRLVLGVISLTGDGIFQAKVLFQYTLKDVILYVCQILYFVLLTYFTGTTLGKRLMNLKVISVEEGGKLRFLDVLYRETIGRFLCGATMGIGYIMAGIDQKKRGLHDRLCDTRVIYGKRVKIYPVYKMQPLPNPASVYGSGAGWNADTVYRSGMEMPHCETSQEKCSEMASQNVPERTESVSSVSRNVNDPGENQNDANVEKDCTETDCTDTDILQQSSEK